MRVFIGIPVEIPFFEEFKNKLLKEGSFKFVKPQNLHITLIFLGEKSDEGIELIKKNLNELNMNSFNILINSIDWFNNYRVIFLDVKSNEIIVLYNKIKEKLSYKEDKPFKPHITLARTKYYKPSLRETLKSFKFKPITYKVDKFILYKSKLTPEGPIYEKIEEFNLI